MAARLTTYLVVAIVSATLIAGLIVGAQRDDSDGPVDLIVHNARVFTADGDGTIAEAVAIRGNQVLRVGDERAVMRLQRPQTTVIDAGGATVLPGFNDAHVHLIAGGLAVNGLDLTGVATVADIQTHVKAWMDANPDAAWIRGHGWAPSTVGPPQLTRKLLDAATGKRPALLMSVDGQTALANSAALRAAGITRDTADPAGGTFGRDSRTRELNGVLKGAAVDLLRRTMREPAARDRERALVAAFGEAHRRGITSVQDIGTAAADLDALVEARRDDRLTLRVYAVPETTTSTSTDTERDRLSGLAKRFPDDPLLKTGAVAIHLGPDAGHGRSTPDAIAPDDLNKFVRLVDAAGWQLVARPATDQVQMTLDAFEHAARSNSRLPNRGRRHRLERTEPLQAPELSRLHKLEAVASLQVFGLALSPGRPDAPLSQVDDSPVPASLLHNLRDVRAALGSDWPYGSLDPLQRLQLAIMRTSTESGSWTPAQQTLLRQALHSYTSGSAWASHDDRRKGTVEAGMLADLAVLSTDLFEGPAALASARVAYTIFDGKIVYRADRGTN
jgi:predicted amidohydrolase YtcJ